MKRKQTAVEWLIEQINQDYPEMTWAYKDECEQAKEMEKEQIIEAYRDGRTDQQTRVPKFYNRSSASYYNQNYGS
jgi:uncharacterized protein YgiB involved in biofilm formation